MPTLPTLCITGKLYWVKANTVHHIRSQQTSRISSISGPTKRTDVLKKKKLKKNNKNQKSISGSYCLGSVYNLEEFYG